MPIKLAPFVTPQPNHRISQSVLKHFIRSARIRIQYSFILKCINKQTKIVFRKKKNFSQNVRKKCQVNVTHSFQHCTQSKHKLISIFNKTYRRKDVRFRFIVVDDRASNIIKKKEEEKTTKKS